MAFLLVLCNCRDQERGELIDTLTRDARKNLDKIAAEPASEPVPKPDTVSKPETVPETVPKATAKPETAPAPVSTVPEFEDLSDTEATVGKLAIELLPGMNILRTYCRPCAGPLPLVMRICIALVARDVPRVSVAWYYKPSSLQCPPGAHFSLGESACLTGNNNVYARLMYMRLHYIYIRYNGIYVSIYMTDDTESIEDETTNTKDTCNSNANQSNNSNTDQTSNSKPPESCDNNATAPTSAEQPAASSKSAARKPSTRSVRK